MQLVDLAAAQSGSLAEHGWADWKQDLKGRAFVDESHMFTAVSLILYQRPGNGYLFDVRSQVCIELGGACLNGHWGGVTEASSVS
jgi:hypothetical protein